MDKKNSNNRRKRQTDRDKRTISKEIKVIRGVTQRSVLWCFCNILNINYTDNGIVSMI